MTSGETKMRVYEIAKEVGIPNKDLLAKIRAIGVSVNNHMSSLDAEDVVRVRKLFAKEAGPTASDEAKAAPIMRRRATKVDELAAKPDTQAASQKPAASGPVVRRRAPDAATEGEPSPVSVAEPIEPHVAEASAIPPTEQPTVSDARPPQVAAVETVAAPVESPAATAHTPEPAVQSPSTLVEPVAARPAPIAITSSGPRARVIVEGPVFARQQAATIPAPGNVRTAPASQPLPPRSPVVIVRRESTSAAPPVLSGADAARSRFEQELERARARTPQREVTEPAVVAMPVVEQAPAIVTPGRPSVGSIISLPQRIKITERAGGVTRPNTIPPGNVRGRFAQSQRPGHGPNSQRDQYGKKKMPLGKKGKQTQLTTPAEHKRVIRIEDTVIVADLAKNMAVKAPEVLKKLWTMGMPGVNINASLDFDTAQIIASEFGYEVQNVAFKETDVFTADADDESSLTVRAPVVTVMGHVDHGKTSLLDRIRQARVAAGEAGGITQHVAAYKVPVKGHGDIVFLDTPGHEAFTEMRARGANATDIVVLVVAANDGVMPQTLEALSHAKDAKVTIIVAVNKIDMPEAQPDRIRQQLADHGLIPEEWGGDTIYINVSALRGDNIDKLLESIALSAEMLELRANATKPATGVVIEACLDRARGPLATVLVQEGVLRVGDVLVAGRCFGKVRALIDDRGESIKEAGPSTPVAVLGLDGVPEAGDTMNVAEDDKSAKTVVEHRRQSWRKRELATTSKVSFESLMERIADNEAKELKIVLKADVQGSAEALKVALNKLTTDKVRVNVIAAAVGGITESDVNLAKAGGAVIVGFHVRPAGKSSKLAEQEGVQIKLYDIIYDALDEVKSAMAGLLAPIRREVAQGKAEVRETFNIPKIGTIAGCMVTDGKITRKSHLRIVRDAVQVYEGKVGSLRRFKDDASEVQAGYECGIMVAGWNELRQGDVIEAYEVVEEAAKL